jgi:hypothetical protein
MAARVLKTFVKFAAGAGILLFAWAFLIEPSTIHARSYRYDVAAWPNDHSPLKIVFLTDLHVGSGFITLGMLDEIVARTNAMKPDMVLLGGDYVVQHMLWGRPVPIEDIAVRLARLKAPLGVHAVIGNHEWIDDYAHSMKVFAQAGIPVMENKIALLSDNGQEFWLMGLTDYNYGTHAIEATVQPAMDDELPLIAFTHSPDYFPMLPPRVNFTFAGHTHGGQVAIPLLGAPMTNSIYGQRYVRGHVEEEGKQLFVGTGIGTSVLSARFMRPPEISVVTLY